MRGFAYCSLIALVVVFAMIGCGTDTAEKANGVVVNSIETIPEGGSLSYYLSPDTYELELTSSNYGVSIEWIGANCLNVSEQQVYNEDCHLDMSGQLVIGNPTTWGLGPTETVTIKLRRR